MHPVRQSTQGKRFPRNLWKILAFATALSCTPPIHYYLVSGTNNWRTGLAKDEFISSYRSGACGKSGLGVSYRCPGFETRAAQRQPDGSLVEVGVIPLMREGEAPVEYWLLFRNSHLVQWGRPEDWQQVAARYRIDFNPAPSVRLP